MEVFKNLFSPFAEKAKSPLYSAFIAAWLVCNWRILFAVFLFDRQDLGHRNLVNFIVLEYINIWDCLITPLILALFYIFLMPFVDMELLKYTEKKKREKIDEKIKIGRSYSVDGNLYYDLKLKFEEEKSKVTKVEVSVKELQGKLAEVNSEKKKLIEDRESVTIRKLALEKEVSDYNNRHKVDEILSGRWKVTYTVGKDDYREEHINVIENRYMIVQNDGEKHFFDIRHFEFDKKNRRVKFVKYGRDNSGDNYLVELTVINNDRFEGVQNDRRVVYEMSKYTAVDKEVYLGV